MTPYTLHSAQIRLTSEKPVKCSLSMFRLHKVDGVQRRLILVHGVRAVGQGLSGAVVTTLALSTELSSTGRG